MNVASRELCEELENLSGWEYTEFYWQDDYYEDGSHLWNLYHTQEIKSGHTVSAYDLGYLLGNLPKRTKLRKLSNGYAVQWQKNGAEFRNRERHFEAETAEDCLAKLAIELFKAGILTREGEKS